VEGEGWEGDVAIENGGYFYKVRILESNASRREIIDELDIIFRFKSPDRSRTLKEIRSKRVAVS
jgi:hypothetical protein